MTPTKECGCGKWSPLDAVTCRCGRLFVEARASHEVSALQSEVDELRAALEAAERDRNYYREQTEHIIPARQDTVEAFRKAEAFADQKTKEAEQWEARALARYEELGRALTRADALKEQVEAAREAMPDGALVMRCASGVASTDEGHALIAAFRAVLARLDQRPKTLCEMTHPGEPCPADQREGQR